MSRVPTRVGILLLALLLAVLGGTPAAQQTALPFDILPTREHVEALAAAWNARSPYVPGELIVKFRDGYTPAAQTRALSVLRQRGGLQSRWIGSALLVRADDEPDAEVAAQVLRRQPEIEWAQPNYLIRPRATPNDSAYPLQWNMTQLDMPRAWDINPGANGNVRVAVVDFGVTTVTQTFNFTLWTGSRFESVPVPVRVNPDIGAARILPGRDFAFWAGPVVDFDGHGTAVAGTALQETNNAFGTAGVAYGATLLPLKACLGYWDIQFLLSAAGIPGFVNPDEETGFCEVSAVVQAVRFAADNGAQVINISLGGPGEAPAFLDALRYAVQRGSFVAMPSGNSFEEGNLTDYPGAYAAQLDGAVAVGATGRSRRRAYYSNTGSHVELAAPGGDFRDGGTSGGIVQIGLVPGDSDPFTIIRPRFDRYTELAVQGTSFSAPHVAGVAALLHAQGITSPAAIEAILKQTATDLGAPGRDNDFGFGLISPRAALRGMGLAR